MSPLLDVRDLRKQFGGVVATDGVNLSISAAEIHALIGPNGAGKTTLVAQLCGQLAPERGAIRFAGIDITRLAPHRRARLGLARSFQISRTFQSFSVQENLALAAQAAAGQFSAWGAACDSAHRMLVQLDLADKASLGVDQLGHGERRALEVGMALIGDPKLLLLDEPMAGMSAAESRALEALIERRRGSCAMLLIEHDVDAVFRLADRVSVLVQGRIIASGRPAEVRADPAVAAAYLGDAA